MRISHGYKEGILNVLLLAGASFSISEVMVGEMFMSFRC